MIGHKTHVPFRTAERNGPFPVAKLCYEGVAFVEFVLQDIDIGYFCFDECYTVVESARTVYGGSLQQMLFRGRVISREHGYVSLQLADGGIVVAARFARLSQPDGGAVGIHGRAAVIAFFQCYVGASDEPQMVVSAGRGARGVYLVFEAAAACPRLIEVSAESIALGEKIECVEPVGERDAGIGKSKIFF